MGSDEIRSQGFSLKELFREVAYEIDYYQRDYTWGEEEVRTLLRDLCGSFKHWSTNPAYLRRPHTAPQYFMGPFVYYEPSKNRRYLVDGQQRFVTLHLLFLQLRLSAQERGDFRAVDRLNRVITTDGEHFSVGITDHEPVLRAVAESRKYETGAGDSLSRRNLWARSQQIESQLVEDLDAENFHQFTEWLLDRVVLVGIRAANSDHGYRMFETMNDRGARLTAVDLLKSHLLSHVGENEDQLNTQWQEMLRELATDREDTTAASRYIKAFLLARCARAGQDDDRRQIDSNLNVWVRQNAAHLGLVPKRPDNFLRFVQDLLKSARLFRPFLAAGRELKKDGDRLETVLFNERNGLTCQTVAILAAIDPDDRPSDAKDKGRLVAAYMDRWYALRVLQDLPVQSADADDLVHHTLVPLLRRCDTVADVASVLSNLVTQDGGAIRDAVTLGLRGNNAHQIRYLLARATAYVEEACQRPHDVLAYFDRDRFHIEHLWANHHHRVDKEIPDAVVFRSRRNQLGGLGLLMGRENSSINDLPLNDKAVYYARSNVLLGIIAPGYDQRNPLLRDFIKTHKIDKVLRSFGPRETMTSVVQTRQELYLRLFEHIWNPERLGMPVVLPSEHNGSDEPAAQACPVAAPRRPAPGRRRTDVARMVAAHILTPGTRIVLTYRSTDHWATIDEDGGIILTATGGTPYGRVDEAGAVARGTKSCQGMNEWHIEDEAGVRISLRTLRDHAAASGAL
ncbi:hypothetical protein ADL25_34215 [Streptomyces sp. NRRL F-5122]|uniref:DUF262 domain-containing protein n=1 Tax=Streptomyces sp. NRRL F-5122 TaxID=1609098 RepID=UPI000740CC95|nr:DUF262 domain-containing protein [Streptomyces sp. NRRL F-5122]KUJ36176.1 hypothetical protein ADL25_34215 [Streptomyces sp. NRRL F-5122]